MRAALAGPGPHLVAYLMCGDPDLEATKDHVRALAEAGAAVVELGVPFSDPVADGPTIQAAATRALARGTTPGDAFRVVRELRDEGVRVPVALMTYYNLLHKPGVGTWAQRAAEAGVDACIIPDLPVEEADELRAACRDTGLGTVFLASPATSDARLARIAAGSTGFLYLVSMFGVTGARDALPAYTLDLVRRVKAQVQGSRVPLGVGFGVSRPEQVQALHAAGADAVVVGSAIVQRIAAGAEPAEVAAFLKALRA